MTPRLSPAQIAAHTEWIDRARRGNVRAELERRGLWSAKMSGDSGVPCPACGGRDRFAVNVRKNVFYCRASGQGGDAIALVQHLDGCNFLRAVETLAGSPPPDSAVTETVQERRERERRMKERAEEALQRAEKARQEEISWWRIGRTSAHELWCASSPIAATPADAYLKKRGLKAPEGAHLRYQPNMKLWAPDRREVLGNFPAMIAGMKDPNGIFAGVHITFIDLSQPKGKAMIIDPETGKMVAAKKVRGSWKGATISLLPCDNPVRCFLGEGIETVLAVLAAMKLTGSALLAGAEFRSAVSLGNLAGKASDRARHPTLRFIRKDGKDCGPRKIAGPTPAAIAADLPIIRLEDSVKELYLLGDGDSDPFMTRIALRRAAARFRRAYPHLTVFIVPAVPGTDFNDMLQGRAS